MMMTTEIVEEEDFSGMMRMVMKVIEVMRIEMRVVALNHHHSHLHHHRRRRSSPFSSVAGGRPQQRRHVMMLMTMMNEGVTTEAIERKGEQVTRLMVLGSLVMVKEEEEE